jgi:prevent-host-death family protein
MRTFSSQDLQRRTGQVQEASLVEPVTISHHGRPRHVLMSVAAFEALKRASEPKVYRVEEIPDDLLNALVTARMHRRHRHLDRLMDD